MEYSDSEIIEKFLINETSFTKEERVYFDKNYASNKVFHDKVERGKMLVRGLRKEESRKFIDNYFKNREKRIYRKKIYYASAATVVFLLGIWAAFGLLNKPDTLQTIKSVEIIPKKIFIPLTDKSSNPLGYAGRNEQQYIPVLLYISTHGFMVDANNNIGRNDSLSVSQNSFYLYDDTLRLYTDRELDKKNMKLEKLNDTTFVLSKDTTTSILTKNPRPMPFKF